MTRTLMIGLLVVIAALSACAPVLPPLNGPGALDLQHWQVATLEESHSCFILKLNRDGDETAIYERGKPNYADYFRLTPGRYVIAYQCWYKHADESRSDAVDLKPGRVYRVHSKRNILSNKVTVWIEDSETREVLAGNR
jgi:hypothetical protein